MSAVLGPLPRFLALDSQGNPGAGCKLYTYAAGTSTPLVTYSDYAGAVPNTNPVIFDSRGEASVYFTAGVGYKLVLKDPSDVTIRTDDDYYAINPALSALAGLTFAANNLILLTGANAAAVGQLTDAYVAVGNKDGVAATASMRTLGTGAQQAAAGNHTHSHTALTDIGTNTHAQIDTQLNLKASDNAVPHLTGNESIGGVKSFTDMTKFSRGVQVASAAALNLSNEDGIYFNVTGTTGITSLSTRGATGTGAAKGILPLVVLKFDGILTLTHSASLILPGAANITTHAGLVLTLVEESAGVWRCIGGNTLFGDYDSQDFTYVSFTPAGTSSLENITGAGKEFPFTPKFTGVYELDWLGDAFPSATTTDEVAIAVDASAGSPTVLRKAILYIYMSAGTIRTARNPKTIFSLVAGTAYTFNVQIQNSTATRAVGVGAASGGAAAKWFIKRIG